MEITNQRDYYIDNLKCFLIITVVIGHFSEQAMNRYASDLMKTIFITIYSFHMPMFIFVSGYLSRNSLKDAKAVIKKILYLFPVYLLLKMLNFFVIYFTTGKGEFRLFSDSGIPWYLYVLAVYYILAYVFRDVDKNILLAVSVLLALCCGYDKNIGDFLYLSKIIVFFPFFVLGMCYGKHIFSVCTDQKWKRICGLSVMIAAVILIRAFLNRFYFLRPMFTGRNSYDKLGEYYIYGILFRITAYCITVCMSLMIMSWIPAGKHFFSIIGERTLAIYFWHMPILRLVLYFGLYDCFLKNFGAWGNLIWLGCGFVLVVFLTVKPFSYIFILWKKLAGNLYIA